MSAENVVSAEVVEVNHEIGEDHVTENVAVPPRRREGDPKSAGIADQENADLNHVIGDQSLENLKNEVDHENVRNAKKEPVVEIVKVPYLESVLPHLHFLKGRDRL